MSSKNIVIKSGVNSKTIALTTANTNYIASLQSGITAVQIEFTGENLPSLGTTVISSDVPFTFAIISDTPTEQIVSLTFNSGLDAMNLAFTYVGETYACHVYRGANVEGIAFGPNTPLQPPMSETWTGSTTPRTYLVVPKENEVVLTSNWVIPPMIASINVTVQPDGDNYAVTINPVNDPPEGNYVIKYCGQDLINVTVN